MGKTIIQKIACKNIPASTLYATYMNTKEHSAATGVTARITEKEGTRFSVHDGYAYGKNLQLVKGRLIVQSWRAVDWKKSDPDSTFILLFEQDGRDGVVSMVHANVPEAHRNSLKQGWNEFYWIPWKKYFSEQPKAAGKEKKK